MTEQPTPTVTISTATIYKIRDLGSFGWADITIDAKEEWCRIQVVSDYGSWQYFWGAIGSDYRKFLCQLDKSYVANKFKADRRYDHEKTSLKIKTDVISARREKRLSADKARELWKEILGLEDYSNSTFEVAFLQSGSNGILSFYDHNPPMVEDYDYGFNNFWNKAWPVFLAEIAKENK